MPRKILQLRSALGVFGAETMILELSKGLRSLGHANTVGVLNNLTIPHTELADVARNNNLDAQVFDCQGQFDWRAIRKIRDFINQCGIEVVHTHGYKANFYGLMASLFCGVARVATCHPWTETRYSLKAKVYTLLDKTWLNRFHRIVAVSETVEKEVLKLGIPRTKVSVIDNGIDLERFNGKYEQAEIRSRLKLPVIKFIVGTVGRLVPEKGHEILLKAAKGIVTEHKDTLFVIVGNGSMMDKLRQRTAELGLEDHVMFLGQRDDIAELLASFDLFVLSSISEGLPMVLLEAMAAQKPVVATRVGSIPQVVQDGENGLLVNPEEKELHKKIVSLLNDSNMRLRLGKAARTRILEKYSCQAMARKYVEIYEDALTKS